MRVKLTKIAELEDAIFKSGDFKTYNVGQENQDSLPIDYYLEGELAGPPKQGESVVLFRDSRNGVKSLGMFKSSTVTEVSNIFFKTENSVYSVEKI